MSKNRKNKFNARSISVRYIVNSMSVVFVLLAAVNFTVLLSLNSYYYNAAEQYLRFEINIIRETFSYTGKLELRDTLENFRLKNRIELMAINSAGKPDITSSGFLPEDNYKMPDYDNAVKAARSGKQVYGEYHGSNGIGGEKVYAVCSILSPNPNYSAIRAVTSLTKINKHIFGIMLLVISASTVIILFVFFLEMYFAGSIVTPVKQLCSATGQIAAGNFAERLPVLYDDEIGELCRLFNRMADELENSENMKNNFISSISHELRTPLTAIRGWSETLVGCERADINEKGLRIINEETKRLSAMVEELLDFSRIQSGSFTLNIQKIDLIKDLEHAMLMFRESLKRLGIKIKYETNADYAVINGDSGRIRQVFINIIDNAIKYCGSEIKITAIKTDKRIVVKITDDGCGIPENELPNVKKRFFKASNAVRGSGIGLSVVNEIVILHGGIIEILSKLGKGTTVIVSFGIVNE